MAGQSQAANLGGMLSQIGNTLGTSVDSENYVRGTQNMFRPDVEADDIEGQRQLMNWQTKLGRTDEARNTMLGINQMEEQARREAKEAKELRKGQMQTSIAQRKSAIRTIMNNENMTDSARKAALDGVTQSIMVDAPTAGYNPMDFEDITGTIREEDKANKLRQLQLDSEQSAAEQKQKDEKAEQVINGMLAKGTVPGSAAWTQATEEGGLLSNNIQYAQAYETNYLQLESQRAARLQRENEASAVLAPIEVSLLSSAIDILPEDHVLYNQSKALKEKIEELDNKEAGAVVNPAERSQAKAELQRLESLLVPAISSIQTADKSEERIANAINQRVDMAIANATPDLAQIEEIDTDLEDRISDPLFNSNEGWVAGTKQTLIKPDWVTKLADLYGVTVPAKEEGQYYTTSELSKAIAMAQASQPYEGMRVEVPESSLGKPKPREDEGNTLEGTLKEIQDGITPKTRVTM
jgi:hypothetical protein